MSAAGIKPTIVADERGEWIWSRQPTPEQDLAWVRRQHQERDAFVSLAMAQSKLAVRYRRWADEETSPTRAAHYATESTRCRREAKSNFRHARMRDV